MDTSVLSGLSAGGIGGIIIAGFFLLYKCMQGKKLLSKCCGAELQINNDTPVAVPVEEQTPPPIKTPRPTPVLSAEKSKADPPVIEV